MPDKYSKKIYRKNTSIFFLVVLLLNQININALNPTIIQSAIDLTKYAVASAAAGNLFYRRENSCDKILTRNNEPSNQPAPDKQTKKYVRLESIIRTCPSIARNLIDMRNKAILRSIENKTQEPKVAVISTTNNPSIESTPIITVPENESYVKNSTYTRPVLGIAMPEINSYKTTNVERMIKSTNENRQWKLPKGMWFEVSTIPCEKPEQEEVYYEDVKKLLPFKYYAPRYYFMLENLIQHSFMIFTGSYDEQLIELIYIVNHPLLKYDFPAIKEIRKIVTSISSSSYRKFSLVDEKGQIQLHILPQMIHQFYNALYDLTHSKALNKKIKQIPAHELYSFNSFEKIIEAADKRGFKELKQIAIKYNYKKSPEADDTYDHPQKIADKQIDIIEDIFLYCDNLDFRGIRNLITELIEKRDMSRLQLAQRLYIALWKKLLKNNEIYEYVNDPLWKNLRIEEQENLFFNEEAFDGMKSLLEHRNIQKNSILETFKIIKPNNDVLNKIYELLDFGDDIDARIDSLMKIQKNAKNSIYDQFFLPNGLLKIYANHDFAQNFSINENLSAKAQAELKLLANKLLSYASTENSKALGTAFRYLELANKNLNEQSLNSRIIVHGMLKALNGDEFYKPLLNEDFLYDFSNVMTNELKAQQELNANYFAQQVIKQEAFEQLKKQYPDFYGIHDIINLNEQSDNSPDNIIPPQQSADEPENQDPEFDQETDSINKAIAAATSVAATEEAYHEEIMAFINRTAEGIHRFNNHPIVQKLGIKFVNYKETLYHVLHGHVTKRGVPTGCHTDLGKCCFTIQKIKDFGPGAEKLCQILYNGILKKGNSSLFPPSWNFERQINTIINWLENGKIFEPQSYDGIKNLYLESPCCGRIIVLNLKDRVIQSFYPYIERLIQLEKTGKILCENCIP